MDRTSVRKTNLMSMKLKSFSELQRLLPDSSQGRPEADTHGHDGKGKVVRVVLETAGRKGKMVTLISGLQHNPATIKEIARMLKELCGTGGTVKNGTIELQGDQRSPATLRLRVMNYEVRS